MANTALNQYLAAQFGIDVASFDGQGGGQAALASAGVGQNQLDQVIGGFTRQFNPQSGISRNANSYGNVYGDGPAQHQATAPDPIAQNAATANRVQSVVDQYSTQIQGLTDAYGTLRNKYAADMKSAQDNAGALRQQLLFGAGPGGSSSDTAGVARARFQGAGRGRRSLLGGSPASDASLGAQLI